MFRFVLIVLFFLFGLLTVDVNPATGHDNLAVINGQLVRVQNVGSFHHAPVVLSSSRLAPVRVNGIRISNAPFHSHSFHSNQFVAVNGVRVSGGPRVQVNAGRGVRVNVNGRGGGVSVSSRNTPFRPRVGNTVRIR